MSLIDFEKALTPIGNILTNFVADVVKIKHKLERVPVISDRYNLIMGSKGNSMTKYFPKNR